MSRLTIRGIESINHIKYSGMDIEVSFLKETDNHYVFLVKYNDNTYQIGICRCNLKEPIILYNPHTFTPVKKFNITYKGYNVRTREILSEIPISENIDNAGGILRGIKMYLTRTGQVIV
jgi:hypothetical protein